MILGSPSALHAEQVAAFAGAGKHVFCEKPIATDLASADRALAAADAAGIVLQVGYNRRFDRNYAAVREAVASGRVGRPLIVRITARDPEPPSPSYLEGRGPETIFVDTTSHDLDLVRFVTGEDIVEVSARGAELLGTGLTDTAVTTAVTENSTLATIDNTWRSAYGYDQRLEVHGTEGTAQAAQRAPRHDDPRRRRRLPHPAAAVLLPRPLRRVVRHGAEVVRRRARRSPGRGHRPRRRAPRSRPRRLRRCPRPSRGSSASTSSADGSAGREARRTTGSPAASTTETARTSSRTLTRNAV